MSTAAGTTIAEYDAMIAAGDFEPAEEHRVELIRGEIVETSPIHPPHENALDLLQRWSILTVSPSEVRVRSQNSVGLPELGSVPQPDLFWVREADYSRRRPQAADVLLIVEVADSSLRFDRNVKAPLYAEAGLADYWIANLPDRVIEVYRQPIGGEYRDRRVYRVGENVSPLAFPKITLNVGDVWPGRLRKNAAAGRMGVGELDARCWMLDAGYRASSIGHHSSASSVCSFARLRESITRIAPSVLPILAAISFDGRPTR